MRFVPTFALALVASIALRGEIPPLLDEAWTKYVQDIDHWAFTDTSRAIDSKGVITRETATRYDPSKPYPEQFTVLSHTGKKPIEEMRREARQRGEQRGRNIERPGGVEEDSKPRIVLNGHPTLADLENATVVAETEQSITYAIPLRPERGGASLIEKMETHVRVSKTLRAFEHLQVRLKKPMRVKVVAKINEISLSIDFGTVDPAFAPAALAFKNHVSGSALFKKRSDSHESVHTDFKRVKPYRDRFSVEFGPSRTIGF